MPAVGSAGWLAAGPGSRLGEGEGRGGEGRGGEGRGGEGGGWTPLRLELTNTKRVLMSVMRARPQITDIPETSNHCTCIMICEIATAAINAVRDSLIITGVSSVLNTGKSSVMYMHT